MTTVNPMSRLPLRFWAPLGPVALFVTSLFAAWFVVPPFGFGILAGGAMGFLMNDPPAIRKARDAIRHWILLAILGSIAFADPDPLFGPGLLLGLFVTSGLAWIAS